MIETAGKIMLAGELTYEQIEQRRKDGRTRRIYAWCGATREPVHGNSVSALIGQGIARFDTSTGPRRVILPADGYARIQAAIIERRRSIEN